MTLSLFALPGQGWLQIGELGLAFVLSSLIGLERELRQKSAGLRTNTIVGVGAALIMLVSKYGFSDVLGDNVSLDPSRVAAQVVSGIGFIGGGLIFVRRDAVSGLTTAAVIWLTAAVGMAAGAGLPILAILVTAAHFVVAYGYTPLIARLPNSKYAPSALRMTYRDGRGVLRQALAECTERGFSVIQLSTSRSPGDDGEAVSVDDADHADYAGPAVTVTLSIQGRGSVSDLAAALSEVPGMLTVNAKDVNITSE